MFLWIEKIIPHCNGFFTLRRIISHFYKIEPQNSNFFGSFDSYHFGLVSDRGQWGRSMIWFTLERERERERGCWGVINAKMTILHGRCFFLSERFDDVVRPVGQSPLVLPCLNKNDIPLLITSVSPKLHVIGSWTTSSPPYNN